MNSPAPKQRRTTPRLIVSIPVQIESTDARRNPLREFTGAENVSSDGAGFFINRIFEAGQLMKLRMPLDRKLRRYDFDEDFYEIYGLVRHCTREERGGRSVFHVGVAFIGPEPPPSYRRDPRTKYEIDGLQPNGFWSVRDSGPPNRRRKQRHQVPLEIYLAVFDDDDNIIAHQATVTENISETGASLFSSLELQIGDSVEVIRKDSGFAAKAVVRNKRVGTDNLRRLHIEFVDVRFPLDGIE